VTTKVRRGVAPADFFVLPYWIVAVGDDGAMPGDDSGNSINLYRLRYSDIEDAH
jgi:hypothetical protein